MRPIYFKLFVLIFCIANLAGCIKEDVSNIGSDINLSPEYAIPFGVSNYILDDFIGDNTLQYSVDTAFLTSFNNIIQLNDLFYYFPTNLYFSLYLPLNLNASNGETNPILSAVFRTNATNSIPAKFNIQVYFVSASNVIVDSLYSEKPLVINAASVDSDGNVIEPGTLMEHDTYLDEEGISSMMNSSKIKVFASLQINDSNNVIRKFYSDQSLDIQLGAKVKLDLSSNEE